MCVYNRTCLVLEQAYHSILFFFKDTFPNLNVSAFTDAARLPIFLRQFWTHATITTVRVEPTNKNVGKKVSFESIKKEKKNCSFCVLMSF